MHELDAEVTIDPIRVQLAPYAMLIKLGVALVCALVLFVSGCNHGANKWEAKFNAEVAAHQATKDEHARVVRGLAERTKALAAQAKAASTAAKAARKFNDQRFEDAEREADRAKRDLRNHLLRGTGPVRLRDEWTCPAPRSAEGEAGPAAGRQDAGAELRAAGAADLVAAGDAADRWIGWLQAELITTRMACGVPP